MPGWDFFGLRPAGTRENWRSRWTEAPAPPNPVPMGILSAPVHPEPGISGNPDGQARSEQAFRCPDGMKNASVRPGPGIPDRRQTEAVIFIGCACGADPEESAAPPRCRTGSGRRSSSTILRSVRRALERTEPESAGTPARRKPEDRISGFHL